MINFELSTTQSQTEEKKRMVISSGENGLITEREEEMVSHKTSKPYRRTAHILNPSFPTSNQTQNPKPPFVVRTKPISKKIKSFSSNTKLLGWRNPQKNWLKWVEKMKPKYHTIWKKASIYEPIMCSTYEIPRCYNSLYALVDRFCTETNTFVFPWGEAGVTLEDVMVLGGFPVTGDSVLSELRSRELLDVEEELHRARMEIVRSKTKNAAQAKWMEIWMERGGEFEHEAFLSYWLSRYVLPADSASVINKSVFQLAVMLARGKKIALAPAVLASIYRDLRLLKEKIGTLSCNVDENVEKISVWAPLQLLQAWIWERFPRLCPKSKCVSFKLPRLARWNNVKILKNVGFGEVIDSRGSFKWRPYAASLDKGSSCARLYPEGGGRMLVGSRADVDLESYVRCIRVSKLVGLDCVEKYFPHRVSMQFGLDQDIPMDVTRLSHKNAWSDYNRPIGDVKLYMPSRLFEADVTSGYSNWWKGRNVLQKGQSGVRTKKLDVGLRFKKENNDADVPPGFVPRCKRVAGHISSEQPSSKRLRGSSRTAIKSDVNKYARVSPLKMDVVDVPDDTDSEESEDHLTLTRVFQYDHNKSRNSKCSLSTSHANSPLASTGDTESIRIMGPSKCIGRGSVLKDGIQSKLRTPIEIPEHSKKKEMGKSLNVDPEPQEHDLGHRIARLCRIVDMVNAAKLS